MYWALVRNTNLLINNNMAVSYILYCLHLLHMFQYDTMMANSVKHTKFYDILTYCLNMLLQYNKQTISSFDNTTCNSILKILTHTIE